MEHWPNAAIKRLEIQRVEIIEQMKRFNNEDPEYAVLETEFDTLCKLIEFIRIAEVNNNSGDKQE